MWNVVDEALEGDLDVSVGESSVDVSDHANSWLDELLGLLIDGDLEGWVLGASVANSLAGDNGWVDQILKDCIVNGGQSSVSWSHLGGVSLNSLGDDVSLSDDEGSDTLLLLDLDKELNQVLLGISQRWEWNRDKDALLDLSVTLLDGKLVSCGNLNVPQLLSESGI